MGNNGVWLDDVGWLWMIVNDCECWVWVVWLDSPKNSTDSTYLRDLGTYLLEMPRISDCPAKWFTVSQWFLYGSASVPAPSTGYDHHDFPCFPLANVLGEGYVTISVVPTHNIIDTWCLYIYIPTGIGHRCWWMVGTAIPICSRVPGISHGEMSVLSAQ